MKVVPTRPALQPPPPPRTVPKDGAASIPAASRSRQAPGRVGHRRAARPARCRDVGQGRAAWQGHRANKPRHRSDARGSPWHRKACARHRCRPTAGGARPRYLPAAGSEAPPSHGASLPRKRQGRCQRTTRQPDRPGPDPDRTESPFPPIHGFRERRRASAQAPRTARIFAASMSACSAITTRRERRGALPHGRSNCARTRSPTACTNRRIGLPLTAT